MLLFDPPAEWIPLVLQTPTNSFPVERIVGNEADTLTLAFVIGVARGYQMPLYFFHVYHDGPNRDEVGEELSDRHAAWKEATTMAGETLKDLDGQLKPGHDWSLEVTDASEKVLFRLVVSAEDGVDA
ncbi:hypothetical protein ACE103_35705 [Bradyrhizobium sp. ma5]|uniref:DUF6894 family protein n=1 Tax=unclassified Bradyrhizobium TaxID=2631580 RepID=UPI001CC3E6EF|nr:hypothetical protein [Bradyrhizobium sp. RD5-C2]GIQ79038.1 hypothetical protein BraRD5C2_74900 [Bradyrhizobium sp. RD5-C2]